MIKLQRRDSLANAQDNKIPVVLYFFFFIILGTSLFITGYNLLTQSIRLDEAQSIWASTKPLLSILEFISKDVAAPLYAILLHFWIQIFGTDIRIVRALSLVFFIFTLPFLYRVAVESSNRKVALLTVMLFSLSPFIMWYTSEARMYTLFTLITSLNHLYFLKLMRSDGKNGKTGYLITTALGLYTHYFFIFLLITQGAYILLDWGRNVIADNSNSSVWQKINIYKARPGHIIMLLLTGILLFLPWVLYVIMRGSAANTQPLIPPPTSYNIFQVFVNFLFGFQGGGLQPILIALWPLVIIVLFFIFTQKRRTKIFNIEYFILASFLPIALVFLGSYIRPIFLSRYLILTTPTLFFIISWLLINNSRKISFFLISAVITVMMGLLVYQNISAQTPVKEDYRGVTAYLEKQTKSNDIIAVTAPFTIYPIEYSYQGSSRIDTIPLWNRYQQGSIPQFNSTNLARQIKQYQTQYNRIFIVLSYDQGYQASIIKYMDSNYKRNSLKRFSQELEVREYQLRYY